MESLIKQISDNSDKIVLLHLFLDNDAGAIMSGELLLLNNNNKFKKLESEINNEHFEQNSIRYDKNYIEIRLENGYKNSQSSYKFYNLLKEDFELFLSDHNEIICFEE